MMEPVHRIVGDESNPLIGSVVYDYPKLFWNLGIIAAALFLAPFYWSFSSILLFICLTYLTLLIGHSVGMHRLMIHRTFECHPTVEKLLIYVGVLVGMSGPYGVIRIHDLRDWAQRKSVCHDFFSHKRSYIRDIWWQLSSKFEFENPPTVAIEPKYSESRFYQWLEQTWRYHQVLLGAILYFIGGWDFVVWGIFVRVAVSVIGHWTITYYCHNPGPGRWRVKGAAVQASNIPGLGLVTYGECWHNNHHAFPESAKIGIEKGQSDPAWLFILFLSYLGLASKIGTPRDTQYQEDLYEHS